MRTILSKAVNQLTGETLAGQVADFCSTVSEKGPEAAIAGLLGTAAGPIGTVLGVAAVFGGSLWLERRSERAAEEKLKQHFAEIAEALAQADIDRAAAFEKLDRIYERKTFVWARFDFKHVDDILARYRDKLYAGRTPGEILDDLGDTLQGIAVVTTDTNERMRDVQDELASMRALLESFAADKNPQADPREREIPDDVLEAARVLAERGDATDKARAAIVERDFAEADRQLDKLDPVVREAFDVLTLRGDRLYSEGRFDEAVDPYEKAFALNSDDPTARHNLAVTHTQARQGDIAAHKKRAIDIHIGTLRQQALGSVKWAGTQNNLGLAWRNIPTGDRGANLDKAIAAFESALEVYTRAAHPVDWAMTQNNLGTAWSDMPTGDRGENFGKAIAAYASALEVYTRTSHPVEWAVTQNNLGVAWQDMPTDDRGANLGKAIAAYESALEVRTRTAYPAKWAMTQNNLGNAWLYMPTGDRGENLGKAIAAFESALEVHTRTAHPVDWAMTQNNLGVAWQEMPTGDRGENLGKAIAAYESALEVRTRTAHPVDWAATQNNLGIAWRNMPTDDRGENLGKAIAAYESALEVRTRTAHPVDWAKTQNNLGVALAYLAELPGEDRCGLLRASISASKGALTVWTAEAFPHDHASTSNNLAIDRKAYELGGCAGEVPFDDIPPAE